jgi:predicted amidophosphoribosyltransferase
MVCRSCGQPIEREHRFCPWCATPQRRKVVAQFPPHPDVEASGRGLRVSRYLDPADGPPHTRVSIYGADGRVACVVALDDRSTTDLARFLEGPWHGRPPSSPRRVLDRLASWRSAR